MGLDISKETSDAKGLRHGHTVVGKTAKPLCAGLTCFRGVLIRCPGSSDIEGSNSVAVYVGGKSVTADRAEGTGGIPILPGDAIEIPVDDPEQLYVVAQDENQDVAWMGV